ncbi:hypothetical protein DFH09DRAFT_1486137 [Mycena vulgaris]|nr:hypothetical protein DFH09DRAFT_1486137 [Mycena vulgaris]
MGHTPAASLAETSKMLKRGENIVHWSNSAGRRSSRWTGKRPADHIRGLFGSQWGAALKDLGYPLNYNLENTSCSLPFSDVAVVSERAKLIGRGVHNSATESWSAEQRMKQELAKGRWERTTAFLRAILDTVGGFEGKWSPDGAYEFLKWLLSMRKVVIPLAKFAADVMALYDALRSSDIAQSGNHNQSPCVWTGPSDLSEVPAHHVFGVERITAQMTPWAIILVSLRRKLLVGIFQNARTLETGSLNSGTEGTLTNRLRQWGNVPIRRGVFRASTLHNFGSTNALHPKHIWSSTRMNFIQCRLYEIEYFLIPATVRKGFLEGARFSSFGSKLQYLLRQDPFSRANGDPVISM